VYSIVVKEDISILYVIDKNVHPMAIQISIEVWEAILDIFNDYQELNFIKSISHRIIDGPANEHTLAWEEVKREWGEI
jgi:hypothetical protein